MSSRRNVKEFVIGQRVTSILVVLLLLGGNTAWSRETFELLEAPVKCHWADFSLSRDGKSMGCLLEGAVYWWTSADGFRFLDPGLKSQSGVGMAAGGGSLIAARAAGDEAMPTIWFKNGSSVELGVFNGDCDMNHQADGGFDLNADGTLAVGQTASCNTEVAFVWTSQEGLQGLPSAAGSDSRGTAVSADGKTIVGFCDHPVLGIHQPALWRNGEGPVLFLGSEKAGEAMNVSLNGQFVVGQADMGGLSQQAFFWRDGSQPVSLGNLSGRATDTSLARAVSDDGKVVGWSGNALWGDQEAFIWTQNTGMRSLATYLAARDVHVPGGMILTAAMDISGDGRTVVGICRDKDWNQGFWRVQLGDDPDQAPVVQTKPWQPKPMEHLLPDTLETFQADILNPFPFGKRRYMPAP